MTTSPAIYRRLALEQAWRAVSLLDRNPHSSTRGSFSRTHWAWRFNDFPYPRLQEGVYTLCRLYDLPGEDNPFYRSPAAADWIEWGLAYWAGLQHKNGSFDEAYPFEQCLAATAFTGFYLGRAYLRSKSRLAPALAARLEECFYRAGRWLLCNDETHGMLSNHQAAAAAALETLAQICGQQSFRDRAGWFRDKILAAQSDEGWLLEYDGMDAGYGSHGLFYLAWYQRETGCPRTLASLKRCADFLAFCAHPDGTLGGEYTSRNTEFYYPAGLEMLADRSRSAAALAAFMRRSLERRRVCGVYAMDRFNLFPMLNNLFFAHDHAAEMQDAPPLPWQDRPFSRYFDQAGLWVVNQKDWYGVIGLGKGGTVSLFDKGKQRLAARHAGLTARWRGKLYASQDYTPSPPVQWEAEGSRAVFSPPWKSLGVPVFTPPKFMAFRLFTMTLGRFPAVSRWVKNLLVKVLIKGKKRPPVGHLRRIEVDEQGVTISDELSPPAGMTDLRAREQFTSLHMGSSLYADSRAAGPSTGEERLSLEPPRRLRCRLTLGGSSWGRAED